MKTPTVLQMHPRAVVLALSLSALCFGQSTPAPPARFFVTITQVKPEMLNEWMDIQKNEVNPMLKKAGITQRTVSRPVLGNTYEFISISPLEKYAVLDDVARFGKAAGGPEALARLSEKSRKCINGSHSYVATRLEDISNSPDPKNMPPITMATRRRVAPGKVQDYENFIKSEMLPLYKKAKVPFTLSRRGFGANNSDFVSTTYYNKLADLDAGNPLTRLVGQEAFAKVAAKGAGLSTVVENVVRRRVDDLSY